MKINDKLKRNKCLLVLNFCFEIYICLRFSWRVTNESLFGLPSGHDFVSQILDLVFLLLVEPVNTQCNCLQTLVQTTHTFDRLSQLTLLLCVLQDVTAKQTNFVFNFKHQPFIVNSYQNIILKTVLSYNCSYFS